MSQHRSSRLLALLGAGVMFGASLAGTVSAGAQLPEARVIARLPNGGYRVVIGGTDTMIAISRDAARQVLQLQNELQGAMREIAAKDSLLAHYARATEVFDTLRARNRAYITELEAQLQGYRRLAEGYRSLSQRGGSWLSLQGGVGATGDSKPGAARGPRRPAAHVWGFLQE